MPAREFHKRKKKHRKRFPHNCSKASFPLCSLKPETETKVSVFESFDMRKIFCSLTARHLELHTFFSFKEIFSDRDGKWDRSHLLLDVFAFSRTAKDGETRARVVSEKQNRAFTKEFKTSLCRFFCCVRSLDAVNLIFLPVRSFQYPYYPYSVSLSRRSRIPKLFLFLFSFFACPSPLRLRFYNRWLLKRRGHWSSSRVMRWTDGI